MSDTAISSSVLFSKEGYPELNNYLRKNNFSNIFVLVDSHTHQYCLPSFLAKLETELHVEVIEMEPGEENKSIETCTGIWNALSELGADRKSILINLGGGIVTDLGGFVAATFKRGIKFINFPTTLLAMVDAALGGKTGVNLGSLKNQVGVIKPAELVVADIEFLKTLPPEEMRSGLAEMLKHGLIKNEEYWKKLIALNQLHLDDLEELILESIHIKEHIVLQDPEEKNLRKSLNFGHTFGHAIESYFLEEPSKEKLLHGEAVAVGMVLETYLSFRLLSFPAEKLEEVKKALFSVFDKVALDATDQQKIIEFLKFDKKNEKGKINFVLLKHIGEPVLDCEAPNNLLYDAFRYYID